ncbi:MAG: prepilin-type N-terminal cleavage/methylation domain-containing protein [Planctomycetia bacterium]|nr:prepilin-type N-terminal cleavage/methylation domain-containing protein [Planctomycetia bacterium]
MRNSSFIRKIEPLCGKERGVRRTANHRTTRRRMRSGFTLLEVLTAIFVLTFGLLGITAMLQIGGYRVWQSTRRGKASFIAEQAFADIRIRGTIPALEKYTGSLPFADRSLVVYDPEGTFHTMLLREQETGGKGDAGRFGSRLGDYRFPSYFSSYDRDLGSWEDLGDSVLNGNNAFTAPVRTRPTRSKDDLIWNTDNPERRPVAQWLTTDLSLVPLVDDSTEGMARTDVVAPAYEGNWSWMAIIQPAADVVEMRRSQNAATRVREITDTYEISVAVYESRSYASEMGYEVDVADAESLLDAMFRKTFRVVPHSGYDGVTPNRTLFQPGHWVAIVGSPAEMYDSTNGELVDDYGTFPLSGDQRVVWMQVVGATGTEKGYEVQLTGPDLVSVVRTDTIDRSGEKTSKYVPTLISPYRSVYVITDPEIVGVVTRTVSITE